MTRFGPSPLWAGVFFLLLPIGTVHSQEAPWWEALGADPLWLGAGPIFPPDSTEASVESRSALDLRRPLRLNPTESRIRFVPCTDTSFLSVCGGMWTERTNMALGQPDWSMQSAKSTATGIEGHVRATLDSLAIFGRVRSGEGVEDQSFGVEARHAGARIFAGAGRIRHWSELDISTPSGSLGLPWGDVVDSGLVGLAVPVGSMIGSASLWATDRNALGDLGLSDTGGSLGWSVGLSLPSWHGNWEGSLVREDRRLSTTGRQGGRIFHQQEFSSARAQADLSWSGEKWQVRTGARQFRLDAPQGNLGDPTVAWNRLSGQPLASLYAVAVDQEDYYSGSLSANRWDAGFRYIWSQNAWSVRAGLSGFLWTVRAELLRRRLRVVGFIPAVSVDSMVSGAGWFVASGPEAAVSWAPAGLGQLELSGSWNAPLAGNWRDRRHGSGTNTGGSSLPIDPWSLWSLQLSWKP